MTKRPKPTNHGRDHEHGGADPHRIHYEDVGGAGAGGLAILYDTYPQSGGYIAANTDGGGISFTNLDTGDNNPVSLTNRDDGGIKLADEGDGGINIQCSGSGEILLQVSAGNVRITGLPTTDPGVIGALWNDGGTLKISG